jgi:hypothetical protein
MLGAFALLLAVDWVAYLAFGRWLAWPLLILLALAWPILMTAIT